MSWEIQYFIMIRLKFLGTSNANPHPDRRQSGVLLSIDETHYLFDCGDAIATALWNDKSISLNHLNAVFFSHRHADHMGGLSALVLLMHQRIKNSREIQPGAGFEWRTPPKPSTTNECAFFIPGDEDQAEFFSELLDRMHTADFEIAFRKKLYPFQGRSLIFDDGQIQVESFPTNHCMDSAGFILRSRSKSLIYSGDIKNPQIVANIIGSDVLDLVIIENAHLDRKSVV